MPMASLLGLDGRSGQTGASGITASGAGTGKDRFGGAGDDAELEDAALQALEQEQEDWQQEQQQQVRDCGGWPRVQWTFIWARTQNVC